MQTEPRAHFYHPELDGLRFIAFLLVFVHNSPYLESNKIWKALSEYGWIGVDLFFCLSAFLITKLLVAEFKQEGKVNVRNFYLRRILRIWPLYFTYIVIVLFFTIQNQDGADLFAHLAGLISFTSNWVYIFLFPYLITVFVHLWTIAYEEQFYLVIPWVLNTALKGSQQSRWVFLAVLFALGNLIRAGLIFYQVKHPAIYMLPFTRFEAILGGFAIGLGLFDRLFNRIRNWVLLVVGILLNGLVFLLPNTYNIGWNLMPTYFFIGIGMTLMTFSAVQGREWLFTKILKNRLIIYLGKISYGLYVFHIISIMLSLQLVTNLLRIGPQQPVSYHLLVSAISLILTILLSTISYHWLERPFLRIKERISVVYSRPV
ncbi:MAG: acyltransferase family protein [Chloroflexota bacterium]